MPSKSSRLGDLAAAEVDTSDLEKIDRFFKEYIFGFIYHDIYSAITGKANYLAALGLVCYTEFMGSLVRGDFGNKAPRLSQLRFDEFLRRMGNEYGGLVQSPKVLEVYGRVRCGLAHAYFIDGTATVAMGNDRDACGIMLVDGVVVFSVRKYFGDFRRACDELHRELVVRQDTTMIRRVTPALRRAAVWESRALSKPV